MIRKVLIAEDYESSNIAVQKTLEELQIDQPEHVFHCDDALDRIVKAKQRGQSFDLLITDLSFEEEEGRPQTIKNGTALIEAARQVQPDLKILVFSITSHVEIIDKLYNALSIDGYVRKARNDAKELKQAIEQIGRHQQYLPRKLKDLISQKNAHNFSECDIEIITLLIEGHSIKEMPSYLKEKNIQPSGLSSIEKRLKLMKDAYGFSNNEQLVAYCQKRGII